MLALKKCSFLPVFGTLWLTRDKSTALTRQKRQEQKNHKTNSTALHLPSPSSSESNIRQMPFSFSVTSARTRQYTILATRLSVVDADIDEEARMTVGRGGKTHWKQIITISQRRQATERYHCHKNQSVRNIIPLPTT